MALSVYDNYEDNTRRPGFSLHLYCDICMRLQQVIRIKVTKEEGFSESFQSGYPSLRPY